MGITPREFDKLTPYEFAFITQAHRKAHGVKESSAPTDEEFFERIGAV